MVKMFSLSNLWCFPFSLGVQQGSMQKESRHQQSRKAVIRMLGKWIRPLSADALYMRIEMFLLLCCELNERNECWILYYVALGIFALSLPALFILKMAFVVFVCIHYELWKDAAWIFIYYIPGAAFFFPLNTGNYFQPSKKSDLMGTLVYSIRVDCWLWS